MGSHGRPTLAEDFAKANLIKDQKLRQRVLDFFRRNQNITANVGVATANLFQTLLVGFPTIVPGYSRMENQRLDPAIREIFLHHGMDAAYPPLKARNGKYARFDQTYFWASYYPVIQSQFMSMGLFNEHATPTDIMNAVFTAFGSLLNWGYHEVWSQDTSNASDEVGSPSKMPIKPAKAVKYTDDTKTVSSNRGSLDGSAQQNTASAHEDPATSPPPDADAKAMKTNLDLLNQLSFDNTK